MSPKKQLKISIYILVAIIVTGFFVTTTNSHHSSHMHKLSAGMSWTLQLTGFLISTLSALLYIAGLLGDNKNQNKDRSITISFLFGITLYSMSWAAILAIMMITICPSIFSIFKEQDHSELNLQNETNKSANKTQ